MKTVSCIRGQKLVGKKKPLKSVRANYYGAENFSFSLSLSLQANHQPLA